MHKKNSGILSVVIAFSIFSYSGCAFSFDAENVYSLLLAFTEQKEEITNQIVTVDDNRYSLQLPKGITVTMHHNRGNFSHFTFSRDNLYHNVHIDDMQKNISETVDEQTGESVPLFELSPDGFGVSLQLTSDSMIADVSAIPDYIPIHGDEAKAKAVIIQYRSLDMLQQINAPKSVRIEIPDDGSLKAYQYNAFGNPFRLNTPPHIKTVAWTSTMIE